MKLIDLAGCEFGRLRVVRRVPNQGGQTRWACRCACGADTEVTAGNLRSGKQVSCGCRRVEMTRSISRFRLLDDLVGRRFGMLTVTALHVDHGRRSRNRHWWCVCDCGERASISAATLKAGRARSCGCRSPFRSTHHQSRTRGYKRAHAALRRARRRCAKSGYVNIDAILERDGWRCYICGTHTPVSLRGHKDRNSPEVDHIQPLSRGGAHSSENLACICLYCNHQKQARTLMEFLAVLQARSLKQEACLGYG